MARKTESPCQTFRLRGAPTITMVMKNEDREAETAAFLEWLRTAAPPPDRPRYPIACAPDAPHLELEPGCYWIRPAHSDE
jgi:hypothetical protein